MLGEPTLPDTAPDAVPRPGWGQDPAAAAPPQVSLIICTLDEAGAIPGVLREASAVLAPWTHEIIVVDDSAGDETADAVTAFALSHPTVRLLRRRGERGLASAVIAGWDAARGQRLAVCDGDGQHDLQLLPRMLEAMDHDGADLAAVSRYIEGRTGLGAMRSAMSRVATRATTGLLASGLTDPLSGFFVISRETFETARPNLAGVGFKILVDVVGSAPAPLKVCEVAGALRDREHGVSKLDVRVIADLAALLVEKRTGGLIPARLVLFGAVGLSGVAANISVLDVLHRLLPFKFAQAGAILAAMSWNFWINNILTFRDMRLRGAALWRGVFTFYAACLGGGILSEVLSAVLYSHGVSWLFAGVSGAISAGLWNYYASRRATWGLDQGEKLPPIAAPVAQD